MKLLAAISSLVLLAGVGCASQKSAETPVAKRSVTDVTPISAPAPAFKPEPITAAPVAPIASEPVVSSTPTGPAASSNTHVVKKGETLYSIAKQKYGSGKQWQKIASANPGLTPATLKVGQTITIPQ